MRLRTSPIGTVAYLIWILFWILPISGEFDFDTKALLVLPEWATEITWATIPIAAPTRTAPKARPHPLRFLANLLVDITCIPKTSRIAHGQPNTRQELAQGCHSSSV